MWGRSSSETAALPALERQGSVHRQWNAQLSSSDAAQPQQLETVEPPRQGQAALPSGATGAVAAAAAAATADAPEEVAELSQSADAVAAQEWVDEPVVVSEVESFDVASFAEHGGELRGTSADGAAVPEPTLDMPPASPMRPMGMEATDNLGGEEPPAELDLAELLRRSESGPVLGEEPAEAVAVAVHDAHPQAAQLELELKQQTLTVLPPVEEESLPLAAPPAHPAAPASHRRRTSHAGGAPASTSRCRKSVPRLSAAADSMTASAAAAPTATLTGAAGLEVQQGDIIAELEAQRARHNEQVGGHGQRQAPPSLKRACA